MDSDPTLFARIIGPGKVPEAGYPQAIVSIRSNLSVGYGYGGVDDRSRNTPRKGGKKKSK
jgi:hypothetical protein